MTATAVPVPGGQIQFCDANGAPYAGGLVYMWQPPGTSVSKPTWQDPLQTIPNSNPITLDSAGRAIIWGSGIYRQQLFDALGNLIWDQPTEAADPNYVISLIPAFVGDSGAGGVAGFVPAPGAGSAAAGDYLSADGAFQPLLVVVPAAPANNQAGFLFVPSRTIAITTGALVLTDAGGNVTYSNASAGTLTLPSDATALWPASPITQIMLSNPVGSGNLTVTRAAGVSLVWPGSSGTSADRVIAANGQALLSRIGTNSWTIVGAGIS